MTVAALALPAAVANAPAAGCLAVDPTRFAEVRSEGPLAGFAGWTLQSGFTLDRLPMTPTALAFDGARTCDLTHGLAKFLGARAAPASASEALDLALLAVETRFVDAFPHAVMLPALGLAADAASVTPLAHGYAVDFTAWTPQQGTVARFHVVMDGQVDLHFRVLAYAQGAFTPSDHGWILVPGMTDATLAGFATDSPAQITGPNGDGSSWRVTYDTSNYASAAEALSYAQMALSFAQEVYASETAPWGFTSHDPDRILDITLDGCDCIYGGSQANVHLFPRPNDILPLVPGLAYPGTEWDVGDLILGHEFFHHLEYGINSWRAGGYQVEGMARFSETVHVPVIEFAPTTLYYRNDANGANAYILNPNFGLNRQYGYEVALVWTWLYAHDGGMAFIKRALEETRVGGTAPDVDGVEAIDRAIAAQPTHEHASYAEALAAMSVATITHKGWTYGKVDGSDPRDWSTFFAATPLMPVSTAAANAKYRDGGVRVDGYECFRGPAGASVAIASAADSTTTATLAALSGGAWSTTTVAPATTASNVDASYVCMSRVLPLAQVASAGSLPVGGGGTDPVGIAGNTAAGISAYYGVAYSTL